MTLEVDIEEEVCKQALGLGVTNVKLKSVVNFYPDRMFFIPGGRPLFIEFKRPGDGELSAGQKVIIRRLKYYGYNVEVHDTITGAVAAVEKALLEAARLSKARRKVSTGAP